MLDRKSKFFGGRYMEWNKLNLNEIEYFCKHLKCRVEFDCLPFSWALESVIKIFSYYKIEQFEIHDIVLFYKMIKAKSARTDKVKKYTLTQIRNGLNRMKEVECIENNSYKINYIDSSIYDNELKYGYENGYIKDTCSISIPTEKDIK